VESNLALPKKLSRKIPYYPEILAIYLSVYLSICLTIIGKRYSIRYRINIHNSSKIETIKVMPMNEEINTM
jgi:hypothetical protein